MSDFLNKRSKPDFSTLNQDELNLLCKDLGYDYTSKSRKEIIDDILILWKNTKFEINTECCICMEPLINGDNLTTGCSHQFHSSCIFKCFMKKKYECPICRNVLLENMTEPESDEEGTLYNWSDTGISFRDDIRDNIIISENNINEHDNESIWETESSISSISETNTDRTIKNISLDDLTLNDDI